MIPDPSTVDMCSQIAFSFRLKQVASDPENSDREQGVL